MLHASVGRLAARSDLSRHQNGFQQRSEQGAPNARRPRLLEPHREPELTAHRVRADFHQLQLKNPELWRTEAVINGAWGKGSAKGTFAVTDPATGEEIGSVPEMGVEDVDTAVKHAHEAFKKWSKQTAQQRSDILLKLYALVNENADDLARIITLEVSLSRVCSS